MLAISPLGVPMPAKVVEDSSETASNATKRSKKAGEPQETEKEKGESLKTVLTNIHKTEYFLSRLKQLHDENEQYIDVLKSILTSLLQLEETTKNHGTVPTFTSLHLVTISNSLLTHLPLFFTRRCGDISQDSARDFGLFDGHSWCYSGRVGR